jgi:hypothetical protein
MPERENRRMPEDLHEIEPADAPLEEYSLEELEEWAEELRRERDAGSWIDTAHSDGSTTDPHEAQEQGLVYTPPTDPPVLPSDDPQGAEIAAGFATSMEEYGPDVVDLPERVDNNDEDLVQDVLTMLRNNSETSHLTEVQVAVRNGVVYLRGNVVSQDDISLVDEMVRDMEGVVDVENDLDVDMDYDY